MPDCLFSGGSTPLITDSEWFTLNRILCSLNAGGGGGGGGGSGGAIAPGVVDPNGVVTATAAGQYYSNTATGTTWVATAAGNSSWVQTV